jgi:hypothetical protein
MSSYHIDWSQLIDSDLTEEIAKVAGLDAPLAVEDARPLIARILGATGGWPYTTSIPSRNQVRAHIRRLLSEAFAHALGGTSMPALGYRLQATPRGISTIEAVPRVEVNIASLDELLTLPEMTPSRASAIVNERQNGPFRDVVNLCERLPRFGRSRAIRLMSLLNFRCEPVPAMRATGDWRRDLATLIAQESGPEARSRLFAALERVALIVTSHRHPHLKHHLPRSFAHPKLPRGHAATESIVLAGRRYYYYVRDQIRAAERSVDVLMFHIALPTQDHPTRQLLEAFAEACKRGVRVRVLVDRDRRDDPYRSHVINAAAVQYLVGNGMAVRVDRPERLLHSKMIVIDRNQTILGSHNWSAGSFFVFDDLSMAILSSEFARDALKRFDNLWRHGEPAKLGRGTVRPL